ncbi:hypothetical protein V6N11_010821 [Hibiscus sabdariffa]|uniref:Uncharacterized protein n=1 Tax=Hibiscus sabdariffa TaxID=183260 RepID=A0ABR2S6E8_9ROSI
MHVEVAQHASEDKAAGVFITNVEDKVASFVEKTEVVVSLVFDEGYAANALGMEGWCPCEEGMRVRGCLVCEKCRISSGFRVNLMAYDLCKKKLHLVQCNHKWVLELWNICHPNRHSTFHNIKRSTSILRAAMTTIVSGCYDGEETLMKQVVNLSWSIHYA